MADASDDHAVVVGAGPNGLVAAVTMARAGHRVTVFEAAATPGGGARTAELTLPGFHHDVCSAIHPLGVASPAFRELDLERHGLRWIHPDVPLAHVLTDHAVLLHRSIDETAAGLGDDARAWRRLMAPFAAGGLGLVGSLLAPLTIPPRHPFLLARFGVAGIRSADGFARTRFRGADAAALLAGLAAHALMPLDRLITTGYGTMLGGLAHLVGWPLAAGGSGAIIDALVAELRVHGGEVVCDHPVTDLAALPPARAVLADVTPNQLVAMAGDRLPARYRRRLLRFRRGPGVFKIDYALAAAVPWRDPATARAATVHVGGTLAEVVASEATLCRTAPAEQPFVLAVQPSAFDPTRAPLGRHVLWVYCHVPHGSPVDMTARIEAQMERFAPGFRDLVLGRHVLGPADLEAYNANYAGGDIAGGLTDLRQFVARPVLSLHPWRTPAEGLYLCSSSTPPGAGVHGMSGLHAARLALRDRF